LFFAFLNYYFVCGFCLAIVLLLLPLLLPSQINTFALWNIGRMVEPQLGSGPFLAVYLGSGNEPP
jgi:hypothetical protein